MNWGWLLCAVAFLIWLALPARAAPASAGPTPPLGLRSTCIGIYHRYPEVPTTAEAALDDMRALGVEHLLFWLSTRDLSPANAVDSPEFARFAALMRERGLKIIGGVANMLLWAQWAKEHPDWVMQNPAGERNPYGYPCWSNPEMARTAQDTAALIVRKAVEAADDLISSWSIYDEPLWGWVNDNCHCPACQDGYRRWLKRKGRGPADVGFERWEQVRLAVSPTAARNALHAITSSEYREDTLCDFLAAEAAVIKNRDPKHRPVTTAIWPVVALPGSALHGNHARKFQRALDFLTTDPYPAGDPRTNYSLQVVSPLIATLRDPAGRTPVLLVVQDFAETASGHVLPLPSQMRKLCFQAIGCGATGLVPFIYDCGLKRGPDGKLTQERYPKSNEFARIAHWLRDPLVSDLLCRAHPLPGVAVVFPQNWYRRYGPGHPLSGELEREFTIFRDLFQNHYPVSVLFPEDLARPEILSHYRAIVATGVWDVGPEYEVGPASERALRAFVENGGALLVSGRTRLLPLAEAVHSEKAVVTWRDQPDPLPAMSRAEIPLRPGDEVLARYADGLPAVGVAGAPASLVRRMGRGRIGIMPSLLYPERLTDGERYVESDRSYVFDRPESALSPRAAAVRRAVGDLMAALRVPRPVELADEQGAIAWYAQPMTLEGKGYWLTFVINWDMRAHDLRLRMRPPAGKAWAVKDLFTGEATPVRRDQLAGGWPLHLGAGEVRALAVAWGESAARRLQDWRPASPYAPVPD